MNKHEIEIDAVIPDGWKVVAFRPPKEGIDFVLICNMIDVPKVVMCDWGNPKNHYVIVEKIKPRRIVLEETDEYFKSGQSGYKLLKGSILCFVPSAYGEDVSCKIWREVKEEA